MGMNPSKRERWPIPKTTRHVWILREHRFEVPLQGFVVEWRHRSYRWSALVMYLDVVDGQSIEVRRWFPAEHLVPVRTVPEDLIEKRVFEERLWPRKVAGEETG